MLALHLTAQAIGQSGMTVLEELIDAALSVCEKSRSAATQQHAHSHSRSAVLLSTSGKTYTGCDVHIVAPGVNSEAHGVSAERAAFLAAVADGASKFDVRIGGSSCSSCSGFTTCRVPVSAFSVHCDLLGHDEILPRARRPVARVHAFLRSLSGGAGQLQPRN
jgi:cytidine deaminase